MAQPPCSPVFNPFESCTYAGDAKYIFFGRVSAVTEINDKSISESRKRVFVEVDRVFKGDVKRQVEVFLDFAKCGYDPINKDSEYLFIARDLKTNSSTLLFSERWSVEMDDYDAEERQEVFSAVKRRIEHPESTTLHGTIIEPNGKTPLANSLDTQTWRLGYSSEYFNPVVGITVNAKRKNDGEVFQTKTDKNGNYIFADLVDGQYEISVMVLDGYEKMVTATTIGKNHCNPKTIFELRKKG
jgi:hypothetical protein